MKQFTGSWKAEMGKDTTFFMEAKPFGTGAEFNYNFVAKGKLFMEGKQLGGYDKKIDKFVYVNLEKGKDIEILALWFISNNKCVIMPYSDIANPEKASFKMEGEFKSPNVMTYTSIINGKPRKPDTYTRVK